MIRSRFAWLAAVSVFALTTGIIGRAQAEIRTFEGFINDHTTVGIGAWEVHGAWSLHVKGNSGKADFDAALTMERSDYWLLTMPGVNLESAATRNPHTHHIGLEDGLVTEIAGGFRVSGPATVTGNGAPAPFGNNSTVTVDITGGNLVPYSNIKLSFTGDAASHFGTQPLAGVVRSTH
jgi:hypothetical protein